MPCKFATVPGSVTTEELKGRIRKLEANIKHLTAENDSMQEQHCSLNAEVQHLADRLNGGEYGNASRPSRSPTVPPEESSPQYESRTPHAKQFSLLSGQCSGLSNINSSLQVKETQIRPSKNTETNQMFERFLNGCRQTLNERLACGHGIDDVLPPLDVTTLFNATHVPEELSWWALQLPLTNPRMTQISRLAVACVTYHQLRWLVLPNDKTAAMMPNFISASFLNELCIPHTVDVNIVPADILKPPIVTVTDSNPGSPIGSHPMLSSTFVTPWGETERKATKFDEVTGIIRLTPEFEAYVKDSTNWARKAEDLQVCSTSFGSTPDMAS